LRTGSKYSPFPEEMNRKLTSHLADFHFAPTERNRDNLLAEGISPNKIEVTGNTVIDALLWVREKLRTERHSFRELAGIDYDRRIILITGHRRESFGEGFINLCKALKEIADTNKHVLLVYPVHLNPNVRIPVHSMLRGLENVRLLEPLNYAPFIQLMDKCHFIITDSGGIQEEAPSMGKPVLVSRDTTERTESLEAGAARLVGTDTSRIIQEVNRLLNEPEHYEAMSRVVNPYGDGLACRRIIRRILNEICKR
jgi:UDP-N-acetylglucosamine 2-epimerase (non-hydrolysing)